MSIRPSVSEETLCSPSSPHSSVAPRSPYSLAPPPRSEILRMRKSYLGIIFPDPHYTKESHLHYKLVLVMFISTGGGGELTTELLHVVSGSIVGCNQQHDGYENHTECLTVAR